MDENTFFRSATLSILSTLAIETALRKTLSFLRSVMPADELLIHVFEPGLRAIRTIARADAEGGTRINRVTSVPFDPRTKAKKAPDVQIVNRPGSDPMTKTMAAAFGKSDSSVLVMRLLLDNNRLGAVTLRADGIDAYSGDHARLFSLLNEPFAVALSNSLRHDEVVRLSEALADDSRYFQRELAHKTGQTVIGEEFGLRHIMEMVRQVAPLLSPVLLLGETGTGKDVIANVIHNLSPRRAGPFVKVNCGAIPESLIDSELFGHDKGAFTGAISQKRGRFERAHGGTIFLDEIGELPPNAQVRLLRVLQTKQFERVGGSETITSDIRILAATNRDLEGMMRRKEFREDLWFRLNVFPMVLPPLRERKADIPALVFYLLERKSREMGLAAVPKLAPGAIDQLLAYHWPGNVRELDNVIERAIILGRNTPLDFSPLISPTSGRENPQRVTGRQGQGELRLEEMNASHIRRVLALAKGRVNGAGGAAALLGVHPNTLRHRMKKLGIPYGRGSRVKQEDTLNDR
jgi:transcriptional regulator with GAF, ATPase, and Fis domain